MILLPAIFIQSSKAFLGRLFGEVLDYGRGYDPRQVVQWRGHPWGGGDLLPVSLLLPGGYVTLFLEMDSHMTMGGQAARARGFSYNIFKLLN